MIVDEATKEMWDRFARTPDGAVAYAHFQKIAISLAPDGSAPSSALRRHEGRRTLAHELMELMTKGIDESGGRTASDTGGTRASERPIVFANPGPVAVSKRESPRAWLARTDPELTGTGE